MGRKNLITLSIALGLILPGAIFFRSCTVPVYDVVVVGGGPAGIGAALAAAGTEPGWPSWSATRASAGPRCRRKSWTWACSMPGGSRSSPDRAGTWSSPPSPPPTAATPGKFRWTLSRSDCGGLGISCRRGASVTRGGFRSNPTQPDIRRAAPSTFGDAPGPVNLLCAGKSPGSASHLPPRDRRKASEMLCEIHFGGRPETCFLAKPLQLKKKFVTLQSALVAEFRQMAPGEVGEWLKPPVC